MDKDKIYNIKNIILIIKKYIQMMKTSVILLGQLHNILN